MTRFSPLEPGRIYCYIGILLLLVLPNFLPVPVFVQVLTSTFFIIYIGSHNSVQSQQNRRGKPTDVMQTKDVAMFPIIGSCVLFGLYLVFKFLNKDYVNLLLRIYFFFFGVLALGNQICVLWGGVLPRKLLETLEGKSYRIRLPTINIPFITTPPKKDAPPVNPEDEMLILSNLEVIAMAISGAIGCWYVTTSHWASSNLFGIAFSIQGIELLSLGTYQNGCILLGGLFVYDIFWVFGTEVMVTVAKSFEAPIKLLFPQVTAGEPPSMLGLGDIVIPGILIALLLRFDYFMLSRQPLTDEQLHTSASPFDLAEGGKPRGPWWTMDWGLKPYFWSVMVWYVIGLATTLGCMYFFKAAQPALLYLVPACLGSSAYTAWRRQQWIALHNYKEESSVVSPPTSSANSTGTSGDPKKDS